VWWQNCTREQFHGGFSALKNQLKVKGGKLKADWLGDVPG
jgi:hypothetical protein